MIKFNVSLNRGFSFWPFIFIPNRVVGTIEESSYITHESTHCTRQAWWSPIWVLVYYFSKKFRFNEELLAFTNELKNYLPKINEFDREAYINKKALSMSKIYNGMCTYDEALNALKENLK